MAGWIAMAMRTHDYRTWHYARVLEVAPSDLDGEHLAVLDDGDGQPTRVGFFVSDDVGPPPTGEIVRCRIERVIESPGGSYPIMELQPTDDDAQTPAQPGPERPPTPVLVSVKKSSTARRWDPPAPKVAQPKKQSSSGLAYKPKSVADTKTSGPRRATLHLHTDPGPVPVPVPVPDLRDDGFAGFGDPFDTPPIDLPSPPNDFALGSPPFGFPFSGPPSAPAPPPPPVRWPFAGATFTRAEQRHESRCDLHVLVIDRRHVAYSGTNGSGMRSALRCVDADGEMRTLSYFERFRRSFDTRLVAGHTYGLHDVQFKAGSAPGKLAWYTLDAEVRLVEAGDAAMQITLPVTDCADFREVAACADHMFVSFTAVMHLWSGPRNFGQPAHPVQKATAYFVDEHSAILAVDFWETHLDVVTPAPLRGDAITFHAVEVHVYNEVRSVQFVSCSTMTSVRPTPIALVQALKAVPPNTHPRDLLPGIKLPELAVRCAALTPGQCQHYPVEAMYVCTSPRSSRTGSLTALCPTHNTFLLPDPTVSGQWLCSGTREHPEFAHDVPGDAAVWRYNFNVTLVDGAAWLTATVFWEPDAAAFFFPTPPAQLAMMDGQDAAENIASAKQSIPLLQWLRLTLRVKRPPSGAIQAEVVRVHVLQTVTLDHIAQTAQLAHGWPPENALTGETTANTQALDETGVLDLAMAMGRDADAEYQRLTGPPQRTIPEMFPPVPRPRPPPEPDRRSRKGKWPPGTS
jgi:hypothetical protein